MPSRVACAIIALGLVALLSDGRAAARAQIPVERVLAGRLATVEPAARRLTVLPTGEADLVEVFVSEDGEVRNGDRPITLADLVIQVGSRVTVHYHVDAGRRLARRVIVEPD